MKTEYTLPLADQGATLEVVGGKGASLAVLAGADLPVPDGFHVTTDAYERFVVQNDLQPLIMAALEQVDPAQPATLEAASRTIRDLFSQGEMVPSVAGAIAQAYAELAGDDPYVAVRSSATAEDLPEASFAGQQDTYLNVKGVDSVLDAVQRCWASLWTARAIGYRATHDIDQAAVKLAVVVQRLVPAEVAGIMFTADPITGRRDLATISAAWGLGEAVVGGTVTPDTIAVDKGDGSIVSRETADKAVMTVRVDGGTEEQPVPDALRDAPVLSDQDAAELVGLGVRIEELYQRPMDIEWTLRDGEFAIVQARPITALAEPAAAPPTDWPLPDPKGKYMRGSVADFMPDPLTPLFSSMIKPAFNVGIKRALAQFFGGEAPPILDNYILTINDYAYMTITIKGRDWWWILTKMLPAIPRMFGSAARHYEEVALPCYAEAVAQWEGKTPAEMSGASLIDGAQVLTDEMAFYLNTLQVDTLGIAAGTEILFTSVYQKLIKRKDDPSAPTYLLGANSLPIQAEKSLYDLAQWCLEHTGLVAYLQSTPVAQLVGRWADGEVPHDVDGDVWRAWQKRFRDHLDQYGYSIYDLDFSKPIPAHDPTPPLQMLQVFLRGQGRDPHARQQRLYEQRVEAIEAVRARTKGLKRKLFDKTVGWAQTYTQAREDSIFEIGLAYPKIREMLLELGHRLAKANAIAESDDIFWLEQNEVRQLAESLDRGAPVEDLSRQVEQRKMRWRAAKQVTPPGQLPQAERIMGIKTDAFMPVSEEDQVGDVLKGVGASPGTITAAARVLHGPEDFDKMEPGSILVADITTPAWTPLFAMAAGIVTNVGGPLSHGSIVAREYGIPAVLGTGVATKRIHDDQLITVDGSAGLVTLAAGEA